MEEFDEKLRFRVIKNRFLEGSNSIEEEIELRKIIRKNNEIDRLEKKRKTEGRTRYRERI